MGNNSLMDKIMSLPKWLLILIGSVSIALMGFFLIYPLLGGNNDSTAEDRTSESVVISVADPLVDDYKKSQSQIYYEQDMNRSGKSHDYWDSLDDQNIESSSYVSPGQESVYLDPNIYSELEIYNIRKGYMTKDEVDRKHREDSLDRVRYSASSSQVEKPLTREQYDSINMARLEQSYRLAAKIQNSKQGEGSSSVKPSGSSSTTKPKQTVVEEKPDEPVERTLPVQQSASKGQELSFSDDDGIISSLRDPSDDGVVHYAGKINSKPVKATFLKTGKIISGERVTIRLMDDLKLSNGLTIPANTHITGTCSFNKRLKINVTMLHFNGRMFPVDISAYDNDGTEGIYCPAAGEGEKAGKKAKEVAGDVLSSAGSVFGSVMTGNVFAGRAVESGIRQATSSVRGDGTVEVQVSAGYQFYVFENVKDSN